MIYITAFLSAVAVSVAVCFGIVVNNNMKWWTETKAEIRELQYRANCLEETLNNLTIEEE